MTRGLSSYQQRSGSGTMHVCVGNNDEFAETRVCIENTGKYGGQMEGSVSDPTLAVNQKKSVNKCIKRKYKQGSKIVLENHQAKFFWNDSRRGEKSKHFDNVNNLAIQTSRHSCSLNKNITTSKRLWQESRDGEVHEKCQTQKCEVSQARMEVSRRGRSSAL